MVMGREQSIPEPERQWLLSNAATDFFFLQNRLYPRISALEWVGNRYQLSQKERMLLGRGVFGQQTALQRRAKRRKGSDWRGGLLAVDGHNVQITVESAILGRSLLLANDGALRDLAGQSANFRLSEASEIAMDIIFRFLEEFRPQRLLCLFDAPMSHSGALANAYKERMKRIGLKGESRTAPVPEKEMPYDECVVASSDREVIDKSSRWLDLARLAIDSAGPLALDADFSALVSSKVMDQYSPLGEPHRRRGMFSKDFS